MVRLARPKQPGLDEEELRAQREAAEQAARLEGDREAAEWEAQLAAELQAGLSPEAPAQPDPASQPERPEPALPTVMIVEPSKVMRIKTSRLLEKHGYRVVLAVDGFDAVHQIDEVMPHALIIGLEITGLDGFRLATNLRGDARTAHLPMVMISGDDDRLRDQTGINVLLGKPYSEEQLLVFLDSMPAVAQAH